LADKRKAKGPGGTNGENRPRIRSSHAPPANLEAPRSVRPKRSPPPAVRTRPLGPGPRTRKARPSAAAAASASVASDEARELAIAIAVAALEKKAVGLEILDVAGKVDYADFLVLMTGRSDRQVVALAQGIEDTLRKRSRRPLSIEGLPHASWVLMDYGDVVVHVFQDDARNLYDIEGLWMDARRIPVPLPEAVR
jgi:ribosome-associated protein